MNPGRIGRIAAFARTCKTTTQLYTTIASIPSYSTLESLNISTSNESDSEIPEDEYVIPGRTLRILFPLTHLTEAFRLTLNYGLALDDEVVSEMAQAWRRIQQLRLLYDRRDFGPIRVTLVGIYAIAAHCRDLQWLDIVFDASEVPQLDYHTSPQTTLTSFEVLSFPLSSPDPVGAALSPMFPNLHGVSLGGRVNSMLKGGSDEDEWSEDSDKEEYSESSEEEELSESSNEDEQSE
ncbi:hypothetical protein B0H19DRAFT_1067968 [Mycena capillaripes]|nr:hypothetical protein B0H19DRAFT_1067968 [Mycena capillaripes]